MLECFISSANPGANLNPVDLVPSFESRASAPGHHAVLEQRTITLLAFRGCLNVDYKRKFCAKNSKLSPDSRFTSRLLQVLEIFLRMRWTWHTFPERSMSLYFLGIQPFVQFMTLGLRPVQTHTTVAAISTYVLAAISDPEEFKASQLP